MQLLTILFTTAMASAVGAIKIPSELYQFVPLERRQAPSSEAYQCHADCGYTILDSKIDGHCSNDTWTDLLDDCLDCANDFDLWSDYGNGVTAAAETCGLEAVPEPAGDDDDTASSTTSASSSSTADINIQTSTPTPAATGASSTTEVLSTVPTTSATTSPTAEPDSAAGRLVIEGVLGLTGLAAAWLLL